MNEPASRLLADWSPLENECLPDGSPRFVFRGGARRHGRLVSPLARLADEDEELARAAHAVCRRCKDVACHVYEFAHDPLEALASLACHGWPTPFVGFTASPAVALAFAGGRGGERGVVSKLDRAELPERIVACTAEFLGLGLGPDEAQPAWLQQRGVALIDAEWRRFDNAVDLDLKAPDCAPALEEVELDLAGLDPVLKAPAAADPPSLEILRGPIERVGRKVLGPAGVGALERLLGLH